MKKLLALLLLVNLLVLDFVVGFWVYTTYFSKNDGNETKQMSLSQTFQQNNGCDADCQQKIYDAINNIKTNSSVDKSVNPTLAPTSTPVVQYVSTSNKTKSVSYVPIPGNGSILSTDWTDVSGTDFYLSKSDFEGLVGVYFEANFRLQNGNGTANLRIYDKTHSISPSGGEVSMSSQTSSFVSGGPVYLWEGNNHYIVQAKSSTSDTTIFESGRLKVVTEN